VSGDALFLALLRRERLPLPVPEYRFAPPRRWRTDYAWPLAKLALEVEGGVWTNGRHTRGTGFLKDIAKYNELAARGWRLLRTTPDGLCDLETIALIRRTLTPADP
jgi:hypothetical protein